jgi:putative phosphoribosyl transferase
VFRRSSVEEHVRRFRNRSEAGKLLASRLAHYSDRVDVRVLALPRGGVPVAFEIARAIHAPLDIFLVRKLGVPGYEELAMGAVASGNVRLLQNDVVEAFGISPSIIEAATQSALEELGRREELYRGSHPAPEVHGQTIIVVDDGLATGSTMRVAVTALKQQQPKRTIVAVPVAAPETCEELSRAVDEIICLETPTSFSAVGLWYECFSQVTDDEVRELLARAGSKQASGLSAPEAS